jgi:hypothetical protein
MADLKEQSTGMKFHFRLGEKLHQKFRKQNLGLFLYPRNQTVDLPHLQKATQVNLDTRSMLMRFFDCQGVVLQEFVPPGQVVNQHYFWKEVCRKHPEQWWNKDRFIHHDSVLNCNALSGHSSTLKMRLCSPILFAHLIWLLVISACF